MAKHKIILGTALTGIILWVADAVLDSLAYNREDITGSLLPASTGHEIFFRLLMFSTLILFGYILEKHLKKQKLAEQRVETTSLRVTMEEAK